MKKEESRNLFQNSKDWNKSEETRKKPQGLSLSDSQNTSNYTENVKSSIEISAKNDNSVQNRQNMEEKELDLTQLLKGCEGEQLFSLSLGLVCLHEIREQKGSNRPIRIVKNGNVYYRSANGKCGRDGLVDLYPSEGLLRKYPLDAKKAWSKWEESRKHLFYAPECTITYIRKWWELKVVAKLDSCKDAEEAAEEVRKCLESFHKRKEGER